MDELTADVYDLTCRLIERESVSPDDAGCQAIMADRLRACGFAVEQLDFGDTQNFWATRGSGAPILAFAGHTDVVPTGPIDEWTSPPFVPTVRGAALYGRGAADMKSALAAMVVAAERTSVDAQANGTLAFLITSDEEAAATNGTVRVVETLSARGVEIDYCVVGEPSSSQAVGDVIRVGRRGSLNGRLTVRGVQGHVAYPHDALNPIHAVLESLAALAHRRWDEGAGVFPPTTFQISNVHAGTGASNVIPGHIDVDFNFRFNTAQSEDGLRAAVAQTLSNLSARWEVDWRLSGNPFYTDGGPLIEATEQAISETVGLETERSTSGGTSDGRFIAPTGTHVVELGATNGTIHQVDEHVALAELAPMASMYRRIAELLLG